MRRWGARAGAAIGAGLLCIALAACDPGEDPTDPVTTTSGGETSTEPETTESSSPADVPTPPEVDPPVPPEAMGGDDREGAAAAAEYFVRLLEYAQATGDTRALIAISSPDCNYCANQIDSITALHEDGGWYEADAATLDDVRVQYPETDDPNYVVRMVLRAPPITVHDGTGSTSQIDAITLPRFAVLTQWSAAGFVINGVDTDTDE